MAGGGNRFAVSRNQEAMLEYVEAHATLEETEGL